MNISIKSYGTHTISDYSLLAISTETIVFPLEGELVLYNMISKSVSKRQRISYSLIKSIIKYNENELVVADEGAQVFIINYPSLEIITQWHLKMVNNVYHMKLSANQKYLALSAHVISDESTREIISQDDAIIIVSIIDKGTKVILCEKSQNNFCCFYYNNGEQNLVSFEKEKGGKTKAIIYLITTSDDNNCKAEIFNTFILPIETDINIVKESDTIAIFGSIKRYFHVYHFIKQEVLLSILFEGSGEIGNYSLNQQFLYIPPKNGRLFQIDYEELIKLNSNGSSDVNIYQDNTKNSNGVIKEVLKEKSGIKSLNWALTIIDSIAIVANEGGLYFMSLLEKGDSVYYDNNQLSISGCGLSINSATNSIAMGDLGGYVTHYNISNCLIQKQSLNEEMIRSIEYSEYQNEVILGVMSGKIYRYNNEKGTIRLLSNNQNEETITCIRVYMIKTNILLLFSTITGEVFIYLYNKLKDDYDLMKKFIAHLPQENNTNILFGSLGIKAEIWSFIACAESELNNNEKFVLATGSEDQTIRIWSIFLSFDNIKNDKIIKDHSLAVTCLDWKRMKHGEILISCSDDKIVNGYEPINSFHHFFKIDIGKMLYGFCTLTYITLEANGTRFAVSAQIGYLLIFSFKTMTYSFIEKTHYGGIEGLAWKGNTIATCGNDNVFNIYTMK